MNEPVRQQALTVIARVRSGQGGELEQLLDARRKAMQRALRDVSTLHFGRFVVLPPSRAADGQLLGVDYKLAIETNFDGELGPHLDELWLRTGAALDELLTLCDGWQSPGSAAQFRDFVRDHGTRTAAFYVAHAGLSVPRVQADTRLRIALDDYFDQRGSELVGQAPLGIARGLQSHLRGLVAAGAKFELCHVERGLSPKSGGFLQVALLYPFELVYRVVVGLWFELNDYLAHRQKPPILDTPEVRERLDAIGRHEDRLDQNGLTHLVPIKPSGFRLATVKFMLRLAQELADRGGRIGKLGDLETIHFARWVVLDDGRLLFFSNYDGSWEAYLGDFIDKAATGLTMIWTNTQFFPPTFLQFFFGARDEERFKRWTRAYQYPTQIWYSAYPSLSVAEVLRNAEIRELLAGELDAMKAERLCGLS